jgi:RimJ/RimL family protein N-acetyltransferase
MHATEPLGLVAPAVTRSITDGVVTIRPFLADDAGPLFEAISESLPQLCTWLTWCQPDHSLDDCIAYILKSQADWQRGDQFNFGAFDALTHQLLGSVALNQINRAHNYANLGYWVRTSRAGQGIATASLKLIAKFAFSALHFTRLEIVVPIGNRPSQRTALKAGASLEGSLRHRLMLSGKLHDASLYSLLPADIR